MHYQRGFVLFSVAIGEVFLAGWATRAMTTIKDHGLALKKAANIDLGGGVLFVVVVAVLIVHKLALEKWPQAESPREEFLAAPFSIFKPPKKPDNESGAVSGHRS